MRRGKLYPDRWLSGPDPVRHKLRLECQRNRAQAKYRGQEWLITEEEFTELWLAEDRYLRRGVSSDALCLTRKDKTAPWSVDNVQFQTRREHFQEIYTGTSRKTRVNEGKC